MRKQKTSLSWAILIITIVLLSVSSLISCQSTDKKTTLDQKQIAEVKRGNLIVSVDADGNLSMPRQAKLAFDTTGTIQEIKVRDGDKVTKEQLLARLDTSALELALKLAENDLEIAEYTLMQTAGLTPPGWEKVRPDYTIVYGTDIPGARGLLKEIENLLTRAKELLTSGDISQAQSQLQLTRDKLTSAQYKLGGKYFAYPLSVKLAELKVEKARMAVDKANIELQKALIIAPFNGIVANVGAKEGDKLSAFNYATTIVVHLIDPSIIEMKAFIDEIDAPKVKLGQEAIITLDTLPEIELKGKVTFVSPIPLIQAGVVSYKATLNLSHPDGVELKDGMTATARFIIDRKENVLLLPNRAIKGTPGNHWVEVVKNEVTKPRPVVLGASDGKNTEVISGLTEGEKVIVEIVRPPVPRLF